VKSLQQQREGVNHCFQNIFFDDVFTLVAHAEKVSRRARESQRSLKNKNNNDNNNSTTHQQQQPKA